MRTILVTGGAGFVGSNLAIAFKERRPGDRVVALDNLRRRGSELNLPRLRGSGVDFVHGDIRSREDLDPALLKPDLIVECSAEPSVLAGYNSSPSYVFSTNLSGTFNCLELARECSSDFIFLSTSRVYPVAAINSLEYTEGPTRFELSAGQTLPGASERGISSEFPLAGARSLYGATKLSSEHIVEEYREMYAMRTAINRCGVVAGPWQMGKADQGVFVHWVASHYFKKELRYFGYGGSGKQVRDLLHIDDLASLVCWQAENMGSVNGTVFNAGGGRGRSLSLVETTALCAEITGNRLKVEGTGQDRAADIRIYLTDIEPIKAATGWSPSRRPVETLEDIFSWIRANEGALRGVL